MALSTASLSVLLLLLPAAYGQMYGGPPAYGSYSYGGYGMPYGYGAYGAVRTAPVTKPEPTQAADLTAGVLAISGQQSTPLTQQDMGPIVSWQTVFYGINSTEFDMIKEMYAEALAATMPYDKPMATDFAFSAVEDMGMLNVTNEVVWPDNNATAANEFAAQLQSNPGAIYNTRAMQALFPGGATTVSGVDVSMPLSAAAPAGLTTTRNSTQAAQAKKKTDDLSGGAIAGIVIGVLAGVALLAGAAFFLVTRRRRANTNTNPLL